MIEKTIFHYKILEKLGGGGMGIVYKAQDLKLDRLVALKFLPPDLTRDEEAKERFIHEAKAASALQHNNICSIHDIDETTDGQMFMVMDCYEGETLKDRIGRGPLKIEDTLDLAIQIAGGLQEAHEKGIVHRDIKPANIHISKDGVVKILDFGLAKLGGQTKLTKTGSILGTAAYMSPEQARGQNVDHRTDLWSLGVVLYEMLTGKLPFRGEYEAALLYSIVHEEPQAMSDFRKDIPDNLASAISKTLRKDPHQRYVTARELLNDLKSAMASGIQLLKWEKSIVVLPFENLSPDPDQAYFSDGLTEEVISDLSNVRALRVISRSSAMTFKGTKKKIPEIAREVNVQYVLEGSVRRAGNSLRITAQLIDAQNDAHLWTEKYAGTLDDVFEIQEKVSHAIVDALKLKLTPEEAGRLAERPIPNASAYEFYLKARQEILKYTETGLENALKYLRSGLEIVGENAVLYAGLAYVHFGYLNLGLKEQEYCRKEAQKYIDKALALDPLNSQGHFIQGLFHVVDNPPKAIEHLKRALETNPNDFDALFFLSCVLGSLGQRTAALPLEERTIKIDPLNSAAYFHSGFNRIWEGEFGLALDVLRKLNKSFPDDLLIKFSYGLSLAYMNERDQAGLIFNQITQEQPGGLISGLSLAFKYAIAGKKTETLKSLEADPQLLKTRDFQYVYWITECLALIDEKERALDWLERDVNLGMINYPLMNELDPFLENIRGEERFKKLMERVKYEWEHFKV
jgi:serine/threonine protein kinase